MTAPVTSTALLYQRPTPSCHLMRTCHAARHSDSICRGSAARATPRPHSGQQPVPAASAAWRVARLRRAAHSVAPPACRLNCRRQPQCTVTIGTGTKKGGRASAKQMGYSAQQNSQDRCVPTQQPHKHAAAPVARSRSAPSQSLQAQKRAGGRRQNGRDTARSKTAKTGGACMRVRNAKHEAHCNRAPRSMQHSSQQRGSGAPRREHAQTMGR